MHEGQLREVDYWIAVSEKVGTERLIHKGKPDVLKTESYKSEWRLKSIPVQLRAGEPGYRFNRRNT